MDSFSRFLPGLRSHSSSVRIRTARALRIFVESEARDLSPSVYSKCVQDLSKRILELLHGTDNLDRIGGIVAMDELVDLFNAESNDQKIIEFAHSLAKVLERASNMDIILLRAATKALGHLVSTGGTQLIEFVEEYHMKPAMTWLESDSYQVRRHAAVMILKELAVNSPSIFYRYADTFFEVIWPAINDSKAQIRESAADALQASLALIHQRETNRKVSWYTRTLEEVERGLIKGTAESMHGSLLTMNELLRNTGDFMFPHFEKVCKQVLQYKDHKSSTVRRAVVNLLPRLAKFNSSVFIESYLIICMTHLLDTLRAPSSISGVKGDAFLSIGKLSLAVGVAVAREDQLLEQIFAMIREGLKEHRKKDLDTQREALACLRMMAEAVGPALSRVNIEGIIDVMFQTELNRTLVDTLTTLIKRIPNQRSYIQIKLFNRLQRTLAGGKYDFSLATASPSKSKAGKPHGSFLSIFSTAAEMVREKANTDPSLDPVPTNTMLILALDTLGSFDLQGNRHIPVMQFVHTIVVRYLDSEVAGIRKSAAITCCKLVLPPGEEAPTKGEVAGPVSGVLERLLTVGIADTEADIRSKVLASLDARFDPLLGQTENLRCLFIALNDEIFEIRETAMAMLGRLTLRNPSYVMPALRQTLVQLLAELEFSGDSRGKEEGARLLGHLIRSAAHLARPFVVPILKALVKKLHDGSSSVSISVLATLGELALVGSEDLKPYLNELLPQIHMAMQEQSSPQKLQIAIRTLGQLVSSTGYVVLPYHEYPELLNILCTVLQKSGDVNQPLRLEAGRTLGILGALDPYCFKKFQTSQQFRLTLKQNENTEAQHRRLIVADAQDMLPSLVSDPSQYLPTVAVNALIRILNDQRNASHYQGSILAIMYICNSMRKKVEPHLDKIIPAFLYSIDTVSPELRGFLFEQLAGLVRLVGNKIQDHLNYKDVAIIVYKYWAPHLNEILTLFEEIARSLGDGFKVYLPDLLPELLKIIRRERDQPERSETVLVLRTFVSLGRLLDGYLHLVIPALVKLIQSGADVKPRRQALTALRALVRELNVSEYASKIIHMLARVIASSHNELVTLAMDCLCFMVYTLGEDYAVFVPVVTQVLKRHNRYGPIFEKYDLLVSKILKYQPLPMESWIQSHPKIPEKELSTAKDEVKALPINQNSLMVAWESTQRSTKDDWYEWMRAFSVELLRESPSPALRACKELASVYQPLARELFNAAFVSVWPHLSPPTQDNLVRSLETAFQSAHLPSEILQTLLNLAEFMEHDDQPLPIDIRMLGALAEKCHSFAKALHYKELEFNTSPSSDGIDALITINNKLNQFEAAVGILKYSQEHLTDVQVKASWHEKLHRWDDALEGHDRLLEKDPDHIDAIFGKMRCLYALGQWRKLDEHVKSMWVKVYGQSSGASKLLDVPPAMKKELCSHAARVALTLQNWELIPKYIHSDMDDAEAHLFRAVCAIRNMELDEALNNIYQCRHVLDPTVRSLVSESYSRAYMPGLIYLQNLVELEEIVQYTQISATSASRTHLDDDEHLKRLRTVWTSRMLGVERNILVWQHLLIIRSLVLDPKEDTNVWLKYSKLCRKGGHMNLALSALWRVGAQPFIQSIERNKNSPLPIVLHGPDALKPHPRVAFTYLKHLWADGQEHTALHQLSHLSRALEKRADNEAEMIKLRVKSYIKLAEWQMLLLEPKNRSESLYDQVLVSLETATQLDPASYRAWHEWALMNFRATEACAEEKLESYVAPAVNGFFRSIVLGSKTNDVTKDVLRLLTLWFSYGHRTDVHHAMSTGFHKVSIDTWLEVIPQLIARIHTGDARMNSLLHELLSRIGRNHPQALIYPITVASKSVGLKRKQAAEGILADVRRHSHQLVIEAELVSRELIRVAILWNELWYEALEEASRCYFNLHNADAMIHELAPLNDMIATAGINEPLTLRELAFYQAFARDLQMAQEWTRRYQSSNDTVDLNQAWDIYYTVFAKIRKQLNNLSSLELANVAPKLLSVKQLTLAVPGTYRAGAAVVRIHSFSPKMIVLSSKQRPRKVTMMGSDGEQYAFLLKGHEDLRQDERVMQLFGLINTLLSNDSDTSRRNLAIQRYSVLPLSHSSGLIGWVPNCDTLHQLIRDYREARKIQLNVEHRLMLQMAPDYDKLPLMQKVEAFEYALGETTGQDLYKVLWLKSQNSEIWLDRRRNYTRSLAVMSMAGYILGLGDRHPSNLMLDRPTGRIVHIDFGDCFEVAMERDKYPEKIPFRLTRMLTQAMEVSGIEGNFRFTCERVLSVLRDNRDSLMAVLEAFIHDPLITWRLLAANAEPSRVHRTSNVVSGGKSSYSSSINNNGVSAKPHRRRNSSTDTMFELMPGGSFKVEPEAIIRENEEAELADSVYNTIEGVENAIAMPEELNVKALKVIERVKNKLRGRDFDDGSVQLSVEAQVDRLIQQAMSHENLCQLYYGWCPFW